MSSNISIITAELVSEALRMDVAAGMFGINFPLRLEPAIYKFAEYLSSEYNGGYWHFYALSNGGFYMAPDDHLQRATSGSCARGTITGYGRLRWGMPRLGRFWRRLTEGRGAKN